MWSSSPSPPVGKLPKRLEKNTRDGWGGRRRRIHHDSRTRKGKGVGLVGTATRRSKFANCGFCLLLLFAKKNCAVKKKPSFCVLSVIAKRGRFALLFFPLCLFPNHSFSHVRNCQFGLPPRAATTSPPLFQLIPGLFIFR